MKAICFDFGNVVGYFDHCLVARRLARHCDLTVDALVSLFFGSQIEDDYEAGRISRAEFLRAVREMCPLRCTDAEMIEAYGNIFWPNPEIVPLLAELKPRCRLLLGSNTSELHSERFLAQFDDTLRAFDHLVLSHEVGARKPHAAFFEHCLSHAGCPAAECLFIDDLIVNVQGAISCGWNGIVFTGVTDLRQRLTEMNVL